MIKGLNFCFEKAAAHFKARAAFFGLGQRSSALKDQPHAQEMCQRIPSL